MNKRTEVKVFASRKNYVVPYSTSNFHHDKVPDLDGGSVSRQSMDVDKRFEPSEIMPLLSESNHIQLDAKPLLQDPVKEGLRIHPIEVVIDQGVVEAMHEQALVACDGAVTSKKETGGFLGGRICRDQKGRCWVHVQLSAHKPSLIGTEAELTYSPEFQGAWRSEISRKNLDFVGFWHSHPTYQPFQSDNRVWAAGADVQTTYELCKGWWEIALVIDPFVTSSESACMIGAYRIVRPNMFGPNIQDGFSEDDNPEPIGWRSVNFAISGAGSMEEEE